MKAQKKAIDLGLVAVTANARNTLALRDTVSMRGKSLLGSGLVRNVFTPN